MTMKAIPSIWKSIRGRCYFWTEAAVFQAATELLQTQAVCDRLVSNAERMFTDHANGVLGSTYQNYAY